MSDVELGCARALPVDGRSAMGTMGAVRAMGDRSYGSYGNYGNDGRYGNDGSAGSDVGTMWERCGLWHGRARYENMDTLRALSADIFE